MYNRIDLLRRAVRSVLRQTFSEFELLIVDDGSTDDLAGAIESFEDPRVVLIRHEVNRGVAAARNTGIRNARGKYVAFLDSDDVWLPQKLQRQLQFMETAGSDIRLSCTAYKLIDRYDRTVESRHSPARITQKQMAFGCRLSPGSTMIAERSLFETVGPMDETLIRLEDWDWLLRSMAFSSVAVLDDVLSFIYTRTDVWPSYDSVKASTEILRNKHFCEKRLIQSGSRLKFLAALEIELAATAYRNRKAILAIRHLAASFVYYPIRDFDFFKRIILQVMRDSFRREGGDTTSQPPSRTGPPHLGTAQGKE